MAVMSTYLAVWNLTSPDWRNSFTPTEKQRRLTWGFQNAQIWIFKQFCVVFLNPPHNGVAGDGFSCAWPGFSTKYRQVYWVLSVVPIV